MKTSDFDYHLPEEQIAQSRIHPFDHAKLLHINRNSQIHEDLHFYDIVNLLTENDVLVFNNTKVFKARLFGEKQTGGKVEILLLEPPMAGKLSYKCIIKGHVTKGTVISIHDFEAIITDLFDDSSRIIAFSLPEGKIVERLRSVASLPLPHYITQSETTNEYQTVYAKDSEENSIAAPTAGFHFTEELLEKLKAKGVSLLYVTLSVGIGTFRPVKSETIEAHEMHYESYTIDEETKTALNTFKKEGKRIIAVGTTCVRTLEDAANDSGVIEKTHNSTNIFIYPPYHFKFVDAIITNFHLPKSTLLMLVSAFMGIEETKAAYQHAVESDYRFFSFGDAMFIE